MKKSLFNRQFETVLRVRGYHRKYADLFPPETMCGKLFDLIETLTPQLSKFAGSEFASDGLIKSAVTEKAQARQVLRTCMEPIYRTARVIARHEPAILGQFEMPGLVGDLVLLKTAQGFLENAESMKDVFVANDLSPDFVEQLKAAIDRLQAAISTKDAKKGQRKNASKSMRQTMDQAMDAVYRLAGLVPNKLARNSPLLAEWEIARRVHSAPVSKAPEPNPPPDKSTQASPVSVA